MACERLGEFLVTRYRSGGVVGTENDGLKGVAGRVCGREAVPPMNVSAFCLEFGEVTGGGIAVCVGSAFSAILGVCGLERSYDSCGWGALTLKSIAISSYLRFES